MTRNLIDLIAGEKLKPGDAVGIGPDGRAYRWPGTAGLLGPIGPMDQAVTEGKTASVPLGPEVLGIGNDQDDPQLGEPATQSWRDRPPLL